VLKVPWGLPFPHNFRPAGMGIILPLAAVVYYIIQQSKYTNKILQQTVLTFFLFTEAKNSLAARFADTIPAMLVLR
jgi:hypothetical protein